MIAMIPLLVCIIGLLFYIIGSDKGQSIGFEMFRIGLFFTLLFAGKEAVRLF